MAKIQCKMCGGEMQLPEGMYSGSCPYCGTLTTFPKVASEELENLYNRAEHFRRINEYDKAVSAYEKIVEVNPDDAEAYWGLVISKFGIEYVEDPVSHERIPTCHRVHYESILADADYLNALEKAGSYEKGIYEAEAKRIAEIQRDILSISNNEQPFDVFICYKESDNYGRRTKDSVTAQEIYYQLTNAGYKVFFSRITLESKLGQQYEPYIFAALNSAKVMLVIGSNKEYFDAVWVRNEWSRFLALMKKDRSKLLIPCYKDMDAYDIPDALSMFQAQDMGKIGFIQDLLHGIKKVADKQESASPATPTATPVANSWQLHPFLRRAKLFLRSGDFESAKEYCEKTLDQEPENGWAYFYRLMAENQVNDEKLLVDIAGIESQQSWMLANEFADEKLKAFFKEEFAVIKSARVRLAAEQEVERKKLLSATNVRFSSDGQTLISVETRGIVEYDIPMGVFAICEYAFCDCHCLRRITIPASVTTIGINAFECCDALEEIVLPPSIECIPANAFRNCTSLRKVIIPAGVRRIGFSAFANCKNLTQVTIPESVYRIEESAFFSSGLQNVVLPAKVKVDYTSFQNTPCFGELQKTRPDIWKHMYTTNAEFFCGLIFCILIFGAFCWAFVSC